MQDAYDRKEILLAAMAGDYRLAAVGGPYFTREGAQFLASVAEGIAEALAYELENDFSHHDVSEAVRLFEMGGGGHEAAESAVPIYTSDRLALCASEGWLELEEPGLLPEGASLAEHAGAILYEVASMAASRFLHRLEMLDGIGLIRALAAAEEAAA